jgi:hypothetical protein
MRQIIAPTNSPPQAITIIVDIIKPMVCISPPIKKPVGSPAWDEQAAQRLYGEPTGPSPHSSYGFYIIKYIILFYPFQVFFYLLIIPSP